MISIEGRMNPSFEDSVLLDTIMCAYSTCVRTAYKALLKGEKRNFLKKTLQPIFSLNSRYTDDAILEAQSLINGFEGRKEDPKAVIFGGKSLFHQLSKKHLSEKQRLEKKREWQEKRKYNLFSRGDKSKSGNLNLRIIKQDNAFFVRISCGERKWLLVPFVSSHKNFFKVEKALNSGCKYTVRITKRNSKYKIFIILEEAPVVVVQKKKNGVIGIDLNAFPAHIAWAEVTPDGNYLSSGKIKTENLYDQRKEKREYYAWQYAHEIVCIAKEKNKAIVLEKLSFRPKKRKGKKLNRIFSQFTYGSLKQKIITLARREGIETIEVHPAYTSITGVLKYAPQYNLTRHTAAAMTIGRRAYGYIENLPKNYSKKLDSSSVNVQCSPNEKSRVHLRKKEASLFSNLNAHWKVLYTTTLTGYSTGRKNPSNLKRAIVYGDCREYG